MDAHVLTPPSPWVARFAPLIVPGGSVLDLACGLGRHTRLLSAQGYRVEALDQNPDLLTPLQELPGVSVCQADVEGGPWPYYNRAFDGIVVTNYLHRPLLPLLINCLDEGGVLIYETFMIGNERFGKPSNPHFLLRSGELLEVIRRRLSVVAYEQGEIDSPYPAVVQRLVATRGAVLKLPA